LERKPSDSHDRHREERFAWIVITTILLTVLLLHDSSAEFLPLAVVILELPLLFLLAKKMSIESVAQLFDRLIGDLSKTTKGG